MKDVRRVLEDAAYARLHGVIGQARKAAEADNGGGQVEQVFRSKLASAIASEAMRELRYEGLRNAVNALMGSLPDGRARYAADPEFRLAVDVIAQAVWLGGLGELPITDDERAARLKALGAVVGVNL